MPLPTAVSESTDPRVLRAILATYPVLSLVSIAFYAGLSLVLAGLFLWRRQPADIPMAGLQLAGAAFAASFFIISIACDYRYMYFTDLAAIAGLVYAAVDPPLPRRERRPREPS